MTILNRRFENPIYLSSNAYYHHTHFGINERRQPRRNGNMYRTTVFNTFWKLLYNHFSCIILQQPPISKNMNFPSTCLSNTTSIAKIKSTTHFSYLKWLLQVTKIIEKAYYSRIFKLWTTLSNNWVKKKLSQILHWLSLTSVEMQLNVIFLIIEYPSRFLLNASSSNIYQSQILSSYITIAN